MASAGGRIIGTHLSLVRSYYSGSAVAVRTDVDVAVAPEWRGRGVNPAMTKLSVDTSPAPLVLTCTDNEVIQQADYNRGHRPVKNPLISLSCILSDSGVADDSHIAQVTSFDSRIEKFWCEASAAYEFIAKPTADWLNWRYIDQRGGRGFVLQAEDAGEITGFVAANVSWTKGYIAYLLALRDRVDIVESLLSACLARFRTAGLAEAVCALPKRHPYRSLLTELGFVHNRHRIPLSARPGRAGDPIPVFRDNPRARVHIMFGDLDLV